MANVIIDENGIKHYLNDSGLLHREDGPAIIYPAGDKRWYTNGVICRYYSLVGVHILYYKSAIERRNSAVTRHPNGYKVWYLEGDRIWPKL